MLTKRQLNVANALYEGALTEQQVIEQFNLSPRLLSRWLNNAKFVRELDRLCQNSARETKFIIMRYGPLAAIKLAELVSSEKPDTARRASLDLIDRCLDKTPEHTEHTEPQPDLQITDEQAQQMLLALAEGFAQPSSNSQDKS